MGKTLNDRPSQKSALMLEIAKATTVLLTIIKTIIDLWYKK